MKNWGGGVRFDSDFSLSKLVCICKSCFVKLSNFRRVSWFPTYVDSILLANALDSSHLDYCNSLFSSLSKLSKLKFIQKM